MLLHILISIRLYSGACALWRPWKQLDYMYQGVAKCWQVVAKSLYKPMHLEGKVWQIE